MTAVVAVALLAWAAAPVAASGASPLNDALAAEAIKLAAKMWMITTAQDFGNFITKVTQNLRYLIVANPPMDVIKGPQAFFIKMAQPFFILGIVLTSAYILLFSGTNKGRAKAKAVLVRMVYAMILVSLSPLISEFLMAVSGGLAKALMDSTDLALVKDLIETGTSTLFEFFEGMTIIQRTGGVELLLLWETFLLILNFALAMRYVIVIFWYTLMPITLLMYSFNPTKTIGKKFLHQTFLWTFVQVGWAIGVALIVVSASGMKDADPTFPEGKMGIACLLLLITTPMMILGVMDWLSLGVEVVEIVNAAPLSIGALTFDEMKVERGVVTEEPAMEGV